MPSSQYQETTIRHNNKLRRRETNNCHICGYKQEPQRKELLPYWFLFEAVSFLEGMLKSPGWLDVHTVFKELSEKQYVKFLERRMK
jgi:hypothetical protein